MPNYAIQEQNQDMVSLLSAYFRLLYEPSQSLGNAIDTYMALPGLRAFYPLNIYDENGNAVDKSGNGLTLTNDGVLLRQSIGLEPVSLWNQNTDNLFSTSTAFDILGTESYVVSGSNLRGLTIGMWIMLNNVAGTNQWMISKWLTTGNQRSYEMQINNSNIFLFQVSDNGTNTFIVNSTITPVSNTWFFACARYRSEVADISIWHNNTKTTNATSIPSSIFNSTAEFRIGERDNDDSVGFIGRASFAFVCAAAVPDQMIENVYQQTRPIFGA